MFSIQLINFNVFYILSRPKKTLSANKTNSFGGYVVKTKKSLKFQKKSISTVDLTSNQAISRRHYKEAPIIIEKDSMLAGFDVESVEKMPKNAYCNKNQIKIQAPAVKKNVNNNMKSKKNLNQTKSIEASIKQKNAQVQNKKSNYQKVIEIIEDKITARKQEKSSAKASKRKSIKDVKKIKAILKKHYEIKSDDRSRKILDKKLGEMNLVEIQNVS